MPSIMNPKSLRKIGKGFPSDFQSIQLWIKVKDAICILLALPAIHTRQLDPVEARCDGPGFGIDTGKFAYRPELSQDDFVCPPKAFGALNARVIRRSLEEMSLDMQETLMFEFKLPNDLANLRRELIEMSKGVGRPGTRRRVEDSQVAAYNERHASIDRLSCEEVCRFGWERAIL